MKATLHATDRQGRLRRVVHYTGQSIRVTELLKMFLNTVTDDYMRETIRTVSGRMTDGPTVEKFHFDLTPTRKVKL